MSSHLRQLKARDVTKALEKIGFYEVRRKGSHRCFKHQDGRFTLVPVHRGEDISRGLLRQILREIEMTPKEFSKYV